MVASACAVPGACRVRARRAGVTALLLAVTAAPASADALWERAAALVTAGRHLVPGTRVTRTQEHAADGALRSVRETEVRARIDDGELTYELVRSVRDGQAVGPGDADGATGASATRFSDAFQADLSAIAGAERDGGTRTIRGQRAVGYRIEQPEDRYTIRGRAWLSEQEGVPLEVEYTVDPLPLMVDAMDLRATYELADGHALVSEVAVRVDVSVFIFYRARYTITVFLDDYFDLGFDPGA